MYRIDQDRFHAYWFTRLETLMARATHARASALSKGHEGVARDIDRRVATLNFLLEGIGDLIGMSDLSNRTMH